MKPAILPRLAISATGPPTLWTHSTQSYLGKVSQQTVDVAREHKHLDTSFAPNASVHHIWINRHSQITRNSIRHSRLTWRDLIAFEPFVYVQRHRDTLSSLDSPLKYKFDLHARAYGLKETKIPLSSSLSFHDCSVSARSSSIIFARSIIFQCSTLSACCSQRARKNFEKRRRR